jgi:hypothetical protein
VSLTGPKVTLTRNHPGPDDEEAKPHDNLPIRPMAMAVPQGAVANSASQKSKLHGSRAGRERTARRQSGNSSEL